MLRKVKRMFFIFNKRYYRRRFIEEVNEVSNQYSEPDNWEMENKLGDVSLDEKIDPDFFINSLVFHRYHFNVFIYPRKGDKNGFLYLTILNRGDYNLFIVHRSDLVYLLDVANGKAKERWLFFERFISFFSKRKRK